MASAVDRFTWEPKGQPNYFVRIKHVVRLLDGGTPPFSRGNGAVVAPSKRLSIPVL